MKAYIPPFKNDRAKFTNCMYFLLKQKPTYTVHLNKLYTLYSNKPTAGENKMQVKP